MPQHMIYRNGLYAFLAMTVFFVMPHIYSAFSDMDIPEGGELLAACVVCEGESLFETLSLRAESVYVYDTMSGTELFSKEPYTQLPLASLTKVMTALIVRERIPEDARIVIQESDLSPEGDSGLFRGESFSRDDLIDLMLAISSNDAARALARKTAGEEGLFVIHMNKKAHELGMAQTFFLNESGLDENMNMSGAYGSARDMSILFEYVLKTYPNMLEATAHPESPIASSDMLHTAANTNIIAQDIPGLVAGKTGYTDLAGGNLVVVFEVEPMHKIIVVVLGSSVEERFVDVEKLIDATIHTLR
ncbi:MAG: D-alanyl-D-alanine carboxypeptidase [Parcubacteria group bacterium]|nr:D-alanyl-D-alanine carboxypeptidase [Parcubacteria group bacterium]